MTMIGKQIAHLFPMLGAVGVLAVGSATTSCSSTPAKTAVPSGQTGLPLVAQLNCQSSPPTSGAAGSAAVVAWWQMSPHDQCVVTNGDAALGGHLLTDERAATAIDPSATIVCGADRGIEVAVVVRQGNATSQMKLNLGGCWNVAIPGAAPREASDALLKDLQSIAPPSFKLILQSGLSK